MHHAIKLLFNVQFHCPLPKRLIRTTYCESYSRCYKKHNIIRHTCGALADDDTTPLWNNAAHVITHTVTQPSFWIWHTATFSLSHHWLGIIMRLACTTCQYNFRSTHGHSALSCLQICCRHIPLTVSSHRYKHTRLCDIWSGLIQAKQTQFPIFLFSICVLNNCVNIFFVSCNVSYVLCMFIFAVLVS